MKYKMLENLNFQNNIYSCHLGIYSYYMQKSKAISDLEKLRFMS